MLRSVNRNQYTHRIEKRYTCRRLHNVKSEPLVSIPGFVFYDDSYKQMRELVDCILNHFFRAFQLSMELAIMGYCVDK